MGARCVTASVILLICVDAATSGRSPEARQGANAVTPVGSASLGGYPESADGLKKLVDDIFVAVKSKDEAKISSYMSGLAIPDHGAWFVQTFGASEGARLEAKYIEMLPGTAKQIRGILEFSLQGERTTVDVTLLQNQEAKPGGMARAILDAMVRPVLMYRVGSGNPKEKFGTYIGDFVYVDGGFRYVHTRVWEQLSTAPPVRMSLGRDAVKANLIYRVDPIYPEEAKAAGIEGEVFLHVVLATDGTVKDLDLVKGDPILGKAALVAVKQWRYKPTLLNGKAVEVDSTVFIIFRAR
jgi:TonB family protein